MGSEDEEAYNEEKPIHKVALDGFYIGKFPVTQALWKAVMGENNNPSYFRGADRPVEMVSWEDAQEFLQKLNGLTCKSYRLPTEAEWEYAARGGKNREGYKYSGSNKLKEVGWYDDNSHRETKIVGLKYPNELGIYDLSGNVWEWLEDRWHSNYQEAPTDGTAWVDREKDAHSVLRGGSWSFHAQNACAAVRNFNNPHLRLNNFGFRVVELLSDPGS